MLFCGLTEGRIQLETFTRVVGLCYPTLGTHHSAHYNPLILTPDIDLLSCLDGFSLVLGAEGDIIYVSKNVSNYMGLKPVELLGQTMADYVHPCDLQDLASLTSPTGEGEVERAEATIRMKCTVTERGRMVNLNQARTTLVILSC